MTERTPLASFFDTDKTLKPTSLDRNNNTFVNDDDAPFQTEEEEDEYIRHVSPDKCLICPITQEIFTDPVVAADGHTYERSAILMWFQMGRSRSPVTNALLKMDERDGSSDTVRSNLAVLGLANRHREIRGRDLLQKCRSVQIKRAPPKDSGARIRALVDAAADLTLRDYGNAGSVDGNVGKTAMWLLIEGMQLELARELFYAGAVVSFPNDQAAESVSYTKNSKKCPSCIGAVEKIISSASLTLEEKMEWKKFLECLRNREDDEKLARKKKERTREEANEAHRNEQRELQQEERSRARAGGSASSNGLGRMEQGYGYFPTLATLQFQSSIPPPSRSVAEEENNIRGSLDRILAYIGAVVFIFFVLS